MLTRKNTTWSKASADVFWTDIAPRDHVVQIYDNEQVFIDTLSGFVGGGIREGECVVLIATKEHSQAIEDRLRSFGIHLSHLVNEGLYLSLDAESTLSKFMVNGHPDETLFNKTISGILEPAKKKGRKIRAFGEMVVLLWTSGMKDATIELERLWNKFLEQERCTLFCAYPGKEMANEFSGEIEHICCSHL